MGIFSRKSANKTLTPTDTPDKFGDQFFYGIGLSSLNWDGTKFLNDFMLPEVNGIISLKVNAFANGRLKILSDATGKEVSNNEPIVKVLRNPNYLQSQKEFLQQTKFFREIYGNEVLNFLYPVGMPSSLKGMFTINPEIVRIKENLTIPPFLKTASDARYSYIWNNQQREFDQDAILHMNRANVSNCSTISQQETKVDGFQRSYYWGMPTLASLQGPVKNIRAAYEARNVLIENRGALGILTNRASDGIGATMPLNPKDKKELHDEYRKYGLTKAQYQIIITSLSLDWKQMAIDADKLKLLEECKADTEILCLGFGVPYDMIAQGVTFDNKLRAERQLYQNTIIPEAQEWVDGLNRKLNTADKSWTIHMTYDHLPVFQENQKERAGALMQLTAALDKALMAGAITVDQYKAELQKFGI
jgi:hypothetical protein